MIGKIMSNAKNSISRLFIDFDNVTIRLQDRLVFPQTTWKIQEGQQWAILGPNGSGKTALARAICGELPCTSGSITRNIGSDGTGGIGFVSFELHRRLLAREIERDASRVAGGDIYNLQTAGQTILEGAEDPDPLHFKHVIMVLNIEGIVDRPLRFLSNGETRKTLIARALMRKPKILILDEPFDGLDTSSRTRLEAVLDELIRSGLHLLLITHRKEEIVRKITHVLCVKDCSVVSQGRKHDVLTDYTFDMLYGAGQTAGLEGSAYEMPEVLQANSPAKTVSRDNGKPIIEFQAVTVRYGETVALDSVDWAVCSGENWAILGPNGSGKTTLISLVYADNLQAYANDIWLFGRKRGSGESIWEIKQRIGLVSPHLQAGYGLKMRVFDVVVSGFFDSTGLYREPTDEQKGAAAEWIARLGIADLQDRMFSRLSYGERRLVIIVRALAKSPDILALDEPCQGLDPANRKRVLSMIDTVGFSTPTQILYVTHHQDEIPRCITNTLRLG